MCGYCTEEIALDIVEKEAKGESCEPLDEKSHPVEIVLYLQETQDIKSTIEAICSFINDFENIHPIIAETILCRMLNHLFKDGFDSTYEQLIKSKAVQWVFEKRCLPELKKAVERLNVPMVNHRFLQLYDLEIYQNKKKWEQFISEEPLVSGGLGALQCYLDWWLKGVRLTKDPHIREHKDGSSAIDYLYQRNEVECQRFELLYRIFFFSTLLISRNKRQQDIIHDLIATDPHYMPDFFAMDLWLQRVAVKFIGISKLKENKAKMRSNLSDYGNIIADRIKDKNC